MQCFLPPQVESSGWARDGLLISRHVRVKEVIISSAIHFRVIIIALYPNVLGNTHIPNLKQDWLASLANKQVSGFFQHKEGSINGLVGGVEP